MFAVQDVHALSCSTLLLSRGSTLRSHTDDRVGLRPCGTSPRTRKIEFSRISKWRKMLFFSGLLSTLVKQRNRFQWVVPHLVEDQDLAPGLQFANLCPRALRSQVFVLQKYQQSFPPCSPSFSSFRCGPILFGFLFYDHSQNDQDCAFCLLI